jgi:hypothetical protein
MSTKLKGNYLEKPVKSDKKKVKEQMLYGIEPSLDEKKKKQKEYEQHNLNE